MSQPAILINVFTVEPDKQHGIVEMLTHAIENHIRHAKGFVSAKLHRSLDGTKVTMYGEWSSIKDYQDMRHDRVSQSLLKEIAEIAKFEPGIYEIVETFTRTIEDK